MFRYRLMRWSTIQVPQILVEDGLVAPPITKHFWIGDHGGVDPSLDNIRSYADLQRQSYYVGAIGRERPITHMKEIIPANVHGPNEVCMRGRDRPYAAGSKWNYSTLAISVELSGRCCIQHNCQVYRTAAGVGSYHYWGGAAAAYVFYYPEEMRVIYLTTRGHSDVMFDSGDLDDIGDGSSYASQWWSLWDSLVSPFYGSWNDAYDAYYTISKDSGGEIIPSYLYSGKTAIQRAFPYSGEISYPSFDPYSDYYHFKLDSGNTIEEEHRMPTGLRAELCAEALSNTSFNSNSIANGLDLYDLAVKLKSKDLVGIFSKSDKTHEILGDAWLSYRYQFETTKSDLTELMRYASSGLQTVGRSSKNLDKGEAHCKILFQPKSNLIGRLADRLTSVGVAPTLYNLWDLVPYSFIVDWFIDVGGVLEQLQSYGRCAAFDIKSVTTSWKFTEFLQTQSGSATFVYYKRDVSPVVPPFVPYVEEHSATGSTIVKRIIDAVALIV